MKAELTLQFLDEWMLRWRKFQTESDWQIERKRQWWRQVNLGVTAGIVGSLVLLTAGRATIARQFGAPHFFDIGLDAKLKSAIGNALNSRPRYTPTGYGRLLVVGIPAYSYFAVSEHMAETRRLRSYLKQNTVFGEQARRLVETGKVQEYLPVDIKATVPKQEEAVYP